MKGKIHKIMVVEDESLLLQAICRKLTLNKMDPISCASGKQALDYLENLPELPDAIWLDYHLKDMEGITFMQKVKAHKKWEKVPVFVVSNSASQDKIQGMLALGAKKYLLKAEHRLDELIGIVHDFIISEKK